MRLLQIADDLEVDSLDLRQVDLLDVHQAQQLAHRLGHFASALVARTAALRNTDLCPELFLVQPEAAANLARIEHSIKEFHGFLSPQCLPVCAKYAALAARPQYNGIIVDQNGRARKCIRQAVWPVRWVAILPGGFFGGLGTSFVGTIPAFFSCG